MDVMYIVEMRDLNTICNQGCKREVNCCLACSLYGQVQYIKWGNQ